MQLIREFVGVGNQTSLVRHAGHGDQRYEFRLPQYGDRWRFGFIRKVVHGRNGGGYVIVELCEVPAFLQLSNRVGLTLRRFTAQFFEPGGPVDRILKRLADRVVDIQRGCTRIDDRDGDFAWCEFRKGFPLDVKNDGNAEQQTGDH